jgi:hypothetical protein
LLRAAQAAARVFQQLADYRLAPIEDHISPPQSWKRKPVPPSLAPLRNAQNLTDTSSAVGKPTMTKREANRESVSTPEERGPPMQHEHGMPLARKNF